MRACVRAVFSVSERARVLFHFWIFGYFSQKTQAEKEEEEEEEEQEKHLQMSFLEQVRKPLP